MNGPARGDMNAFERLWLNVGGIILLSLAVRAGQENDALLRTFD